MECLDHGSVLLGNLNCLFVNARSLLNNFKMDELKLYAIELNLHLIGIAETWLNDDVESAEVCIENYTIYRKDRGDFQAGRGGGVALYVHDSLVSNVNDELNSFKSESLFCNIKLENELVLCIGVCYKSPSIEATELEQLFSVIKAASTRQVLIMGDFNFPLIDWIRLDSDPSSECFLDLIQD